MTNHHSVGAEPVKQVAIIAVHGISEQKPCTSARAIADLLLTQTHPAQSTYGPFKEQFIRVEVAPVRPQQRVNIEVTAGWNRSIYDILDWILPRKWAEGFYRLWDSADERGPYMRRLLTGKPEREGDPLTQPDYLFIRDQIDEYQQRSVYDSVCLTGYRTKAEPSSPEQCQTQVHIYEMYWADLSRLGSGFIRIFGEFYQLLFHLGSLGRQSVDLLRAEHQGKSKHPVFGDLLNIWAWYSFAQVIASRILSLFLPILNLCLLVVALMSLPGNISGAYASGAASGAAGLFLAILVGYGILRRNKTAFWKGWLLPFWVGIASAFCIKGLTASTFGSYRCLAVEWIVLLSLTIWLILVKPYSRHRPGADTFAIAVAIPLGILLLTFLGTVPNTHAGLALASFRMIEVIYLLLLGGWLVFLLLYFASLGFGAVAIATIPRSRGGRTLAGQAALTARLSLALPSLLFSFLTLSLWTALARLGASLLPKEPFYQPLWFFKSVQSTPLTPAEFAHRLTVFSGSALALPIILATLSALGLLLWALVPAILTEILPAQSPKTPQEQVSQHLFAQGLGNWLNNGLKLIVGPGDWIIAGVIPFLFLMGTLDGISLLWGKYSLLATLFPQLSPTFDSTDPLLTWVAGLLTASATGLIAFGGRLNQLSLGLRGVIDAVLDVDNYLRLHPRNDNPTARIYARYVSLLRYLCRQTTPEGQPLYDAFIIVAHSQGTVISADLLRFLAVDPDPELVQMKDSTNVYLFTMGSPLRQLYSYAFPHLYCWAINEEAEAVTSLALQPKPCPQALLGVKAWINTFRSGDYVGRYLWRSDRAKEQWDKVRFEGASTAISEDAAHTRREFCLGAGAHTHYWDKTAPEVAQELDRLIRECPKIRRCAPLQTPPQAPA